MKYFDLVFSLSLTVVIGRDFVHQSPIFIELCMVTMGLGGLLEIFISVLTCLWIIVSFLVPPGRLITSTGLLYSFVCVLRNSGSFTGYHSVFYKFSVTSIVLLKLENRSRTTVETISVLVYLFCLDSPPTHL